MIVLIQSTLTHWIFPEVPSDSSPKISPPIQPSDPIPVLPLLYLPLSLYPPLPKMKAALILQIPMTA